MKRHRGWAVVAAILGVLSIVAAIVYWVEPARSLPVFFPGHDAGSSHHHVTHGIAFFILGILFFIGAWMLSGSGQKTATD
jgi:uncharacterized membrane protein HdeD (DUF308 family)